MVILSFFKVFVQDSPQKDRRKSAERLHKGGTWYGDGMEMPGLGSVGMMRGKKINLLSKMVLI